MGRLLVKARFMSIRQRASSRASSRDDQVLRLFEKNKSELDPIFESGSYRHQSKTESSVNLWLAQTMETDNRDSDNGVSEDELRDDRVSDDIVVVSDDSGAESLERKFRVFRMHNKQRKSSSPSSSLQPEQLCARNQVKLSELAWVRCAARNRKRPMGFPVSKSRKQPQDNDDEEMLSGSANTSYAFSPWFPWCGGGIVI